MADRVARYAKAVVALVLTAIYFAIGEGLVADEYRPWVNVAFAVALVYGVWKVPNRDDSFVLPR